MHVCKHACTPLCVCVQVYVCMCVCDVMQYVCAYLNWPMSAPHTFWTKPPKGGCCLAGQAARPHSHPQNQHMGYFSGKGSRDKQLPASNNPSPSQAAAGLGMQPERVRTLVLTHVCTYSSISCVRAGVCVCDLGRGGCRCVRVCV